MSLISRLTTWASAQILTASALNGEFNNVVSTINNLDGTSTSWTGVKTGTLQSTGVTTLKGSATNDSASAGNMGEYISATAASTNFPTSPNRGDLTSISLTAGDWDVTVQAGAAQNSSNVNSWAIGVSTTSGNSSTGLTDGDTELFQNAPTSSTDCSATLSAVRFSLSSTTTVYLKYLAVYSSGTPKAYGRISARRVR